MNQRINSFSYLNSQNNQHNNQYNNEISQLSTVAIEQENDLLQFPSLQTLFSDKQQQVLEQKNNQNIVF